MMMSIGPMASCNVHSIARCAVSLGWGLNHRPFVYNRAARCASSHKMSPKFAKPAGRSPRKTAQPAGLGLFRTELQAAIAANSKDALIGAHRQEQPSCQTIHTQTSAVPVAPAGAACLLLLSSLSPLSGSSHCSVLPATIPPAKTTSRPLNNRRFRQPSDINSSTFTSPLGGRPMTPAFFASLPQKGAHIC